MYNAIEIKNLKYSIADKTILDSISLSIEKGRYISMIGPNGAGKTTLLKCIMSIIKSFEGSIAVFNENIRDLTRRELATRISYVPQNDGRIIPFVVEDFVTMGRYPYLSPFVSVGREDKRVVEEALKITGTYDLAKRYMYTLSGGELQLIFIAAALSQGSKILLLDEVTTFLDPGHRGKIFNILRRINRDLDITIISITHDINSAILQSEVVIVLKEGSIIFRGKSELLADNRILERAYNRSFEFMEHPSMGTLIVAPDAGEL